MRFRVELKGREYSVDADYWDVEQVPVDRRVPNGKKTHMVRFFRDGERVSNDLFLDTLMRIVNEEQELRELDS